jgi:hypothetical protein
LGHSRPARTRIPPARSRHTYRWPWRKSRILQRSASPPAFRIEHLPALTFTLVGYFPTRGRRDPCKSFKAFQFVIPPGQLGLALNRGTPGKEESPATRLSKLLAVVLR